MTTAIDLVRRFRQVRVLLVGDVMLDTYLEGTAARLCSEGPVPVVRKTAEHRLPGGAANTAANARALGAEVTLLGVVGRDPAGAQLRATLRAHHLDESGLVEDAHASTLHKMRILADGQYVVRFDDEAAYDLAPATRHALLERLDAAYARCDLVIVSDYAYGVVSDELIARLCALRAARPTPLLVDSKALYRYHAAAATIVTPNHLEARLFVEGSQRGGMGALERSPTPAELECVGRALLGRLDAAHAAITLGSGGVLLLSRAGGAVHVPAQPVREAHDIGAGDSFAAAVGLALGAGGTPEAAVQIGVTAAGLAVARRYTAVVSQQELLQRVSLREPGAPPAPDAALAALQRRLDTARRRGRTIIFTNGVFDILHAGHVAFLRQARALGDVLVVGVNSDRSARSLKDGHHPINGEQDRLALVAALDPVDYAVLFDEQTPGPLIRALRPDVHVKGGDYADERLPEAEAVAEVGGRVVIVPLAGSLSASRRIDQIVALAYAEPASDEVGVSL